jgi:hypothetical protein
MSQSVQLDMEVLQRIKFLMEYDVMKTSSENILLEQVSMVDSSLRQGKVSPGPAKKPVDFSNLPDMSGDPHHPKYAKWGDIPEVTLEQVTESVRNLMSDWRTGVVETIATMLGVGIPVVVGANGLWLTLEIIQWNKGNPNWLNLVFSALATITAGSQSAMLKPLYSFVGKSLAGGGKSLVGVLEYLYQGAKKLGFWENLKPIFITLKSKLSFLLSKISSGIKFLSSKVRFNDTRVAKYISENSSKLSNGIDNLIESIDNWFTNLGIRVGVNPKTATKLGKTARWATGVGGLSYGASKLGGQSDPYLGITPSTLDNLDTSEWEH